MADSFADLFRGYGMSPGLGGYGGDQGGGFGGISNSLIGLGMGLLSPYNPWAGTNAWTNALQGYQSGAALDQRARAQQQQAAMEMARLKLAQQQAGREPEAIRQLRAMGIDPTSERARELLYPGTTIKPQVKWVEDEDPETGYKRTTPYLVNPDGTVKPLSLQNAQQLSG